MALEITNASHYYETGGVVSWSEDRKSVDMDGHMITADTPDETLREWAAELTEYEMPDVQFANGAVLEYLESLRDQCKA